MRRLFAVLVIVGLLIAGLVVLFPGRATAATTRHGGWADSIVWSRQGDGSLATAAMDAGTMNMWLYYYATQAQLQAAQSDQNLGLITVAGSYEDMLFNPSPLNATAAATLFNPFSVTGVRTAMNYLIDRSYVSREIYGGAAFPQTAVESSQSPEYARDPVFYASLEASHGYDPVAAKQMVTDALSGVANVAFTGGQWTYKGSPITIQLLARVEDQRHQIGDYVAAQLRSIGFTVNEQVITSATSNQVVYSGDPTGGAWMAYTEGFATTALTAWPDSDPYYFYCGGNGEPFFSVNGGLYSPPAALNDACNRLLAGQYVSVADRQSVFETAASKGIDDSVRVWLAAGATFPYAKKTTASFAYDLAGGPWSFYTTRNAQLLDTSGNKIVGGTLNVGNRRQFVSDWNPWAQSGFTFLYDILPFYDMADFGVFPDPHTGLYIPIRSTFDVTTAGPTGTMPVPATAYWFNASQTAAPGVFSNTWQTVGSGVTAVSKVVFDYTFGPWHDGSAMNMNDVLYALALNARRNYGDVFAKDPLASGFVGQLFNQTFKGLEVLDATHLAIYLNYWHVDSTVIAATADGPGLTFPSTSWTESELAMATVLHGNAVVSTTTANSRGVTSLDLTKGATIGLMDAEWATNFTAASLPPGFGPTSPFPISGTEASARWAALGTATTGFRSESGTYYSSNGPYYIHRIDPAAFTIEFNNFAVANGAHGDYPFLADHFDSLIVPKVPATALSGPSQILNGLPASFNLTTTLQGAPYDAVSSSYIVLNPATHAVILSGTPTRTAAGQWEIALNGAQTAALAPGAFTLQTITVGAEAAVPSFSTVSFTAISQIAYIEGIVRIQLETANNRIKDLSSSLNTTSAQLTTAQSTINSLSTLLYVSIGVAVVAVVVAALSVVVLLRRMPKGRGGGGMSGEGDDMSKGPEEI